MNSYPPFQLPQSQLVGTPDYSAQIAAQREALNKQLQADYQAQVAKLQNDAQQYLMNYARQYIPNYGQTPGQPAGINNPPVISEAQKSFIQTPEYQQIFLTYWLPFMTARFDAEFKQSTQYKEFEAAVQPMWQKYETQYNAKKAPTVPPQVPEGGAL